MEYFRAIAGGLMSAFLAFIAQPVAAQAQGGGPELTIAGPSGLTEILIPATLEAFARDLGLTLRREIGGDGSFALNLVDGAAGQMLARFNIRVVDSSGAIAALSDGAADIAMVSRGLNPAEAAALTSVTAIPIGQDAVVAIVSPGNPVRRIAPEDLSAVLSGEIKNWTELGGVDAPIQVHLYEPGSDQYHFLQSTLLKDRQLGGAIRLHLSGDEISDAVAADPAALGVTSVSDIGNARGLALSGACGFAVAPDRLAIKNEDYPLTTPVLALHRMEQVDRGVEAYISYLRSASAQGPLRQAGFVDQRPEAAPLGDQARALINAASIVGTQSPPSELRRLVGTLDGRQRLSLTFRFEPKSSELDTRSQANVQQLAQAVRSGGFDGRRLTFVGFTDGVGTAEQNLGVGRSRARAVLGAVRDALPDLGDRVRLDSDAFGEAMPLACDDSDWGRHANRRVEVWID